MKIRIKILTPVHIGSGEQISPIEYIIHNNKFVRIDMNELFRDPKFKPHTEIFIDLARRERDIARILPKNLLLRHPLYSLDISPTPGGLKPTSVMSSIKSAGRVYIPGSSLKGSILSGVLEEVLLAEGVQKIDDFQKLLSRALSKLSGRREQAEFSPWLDVRDSNLKELQGALELSVAKVVGAGSRKEIQIVYETLKENTEFETEIISRIATKSEKEILGMANRFYRKVYEKERSFDQVLPKISRESILLRIGQGSTAWSTSFLILSSEINDRSYQIQRPPTHRITGPPRTRKLISGTKSMGWVEVTYA